jgi:hypothetical protein
LSAHYTALYLTSRIIQVLELLFQRRFSGL